MQLLFFSRKIIHFVYQLLSGKKIERHGEFFFSFKITLPGKIDNLIMTIINVEWKNNNRKLILESDNVYFLSSFLTQDHGSFPFAVVAAFSRRASST